MVRKLFRQEFFIIPKNCPRARSLIISFIALWRETDHCRCLRYLLQYPQQIPHRKMVAKLQTFPSEMNRQLGQTKHQNPIHLLQPQHKAHNAYPFLHLLRIRLG